MADDQLVAQQVHQQPAVEAAVGAGALLTVGSVALMTADALTGGHGA